jgi:hypothetical protein
MNRCKTCMHWQPIERADCGGFCGNVEKIHEDDSKPGHEFGQDHLVYSYYESGSFWTGPEFGCVHHTQTRIES